MFGAERVVKKKKHLYLYINLKVYLIVIEDNNLEPRCLVIAQEFGSELAIRCKRFNPFSLKYLEDWPTNILTQEN